MDSDRPPDLGDGLMKIAEETMELTGSNGFPATWKPLSPKKGAMQQAHPGRE